MAFLTRLPLEQEMQGGSRTTEYEPLDAPGSFNLRSLLVSLLLFFSSRLPYSLPCSHFPVMLVPKGNIHRFPLILREDT